MTAGLPSAPSAVLDSCVRADVNPVVLSSTGILWTQPTDSATYGVAKLQIVGNSLKATNAGGSIMYLDQVFGPDMEAGCTITNIGATNASLDISIRTKDLGALLQLDGIVLRWTNKAGADTVVLGVTTNIGFIPLDTYNQEISVGDSLAVSAVGSVLSAYYKPSGGAWTLLGSVSDGTYTAAGEILISIVSTTMTINDVFGGTVSAPAASKIPLFHNENMRRRAS